MAVTGHPETMVRSYHSTLCNVPEELSSRIHHGWSLQSCT